MEVVLIFGIAGLAGILAIAGMFLQPLARQYLTYKHQLNMLREFRQLHGDQEELLKILMLDREMAEDIRTGLTHRLEGEKTKLLEDKRTTSDEEEVTSET